MTKNLQINLAELGAAGTTRYARDPRLGWLKQNGKPIRFADFVFLFI